MSCLPPSPSRLATVSLYIAIFVEALALVALVVSTTSSRLAVTRHVALYLVAAVPFAAALLVGRRARLPGLWGTVLIALFLRAVAFAGPVVFSDDIYRYVWDGRVALSGINPYAYAPDAPALEGLRDEGWKSINHKSLRTMYPAGAELLFAGLAAVSPHPSGFRLAMGLFDAAVVALVFALALRRFRARGDPVEAAGRRASLAAMTYGLCPLACVESAMSGHLDCAACLALLGALALLPSKTEKRGGAVGAMLAVGAALKLAPGLLLPFVARRSATAWLAFLGVTLCCFVPVAMSGPAAFETLDAFGRKWEGNAGLFALVKAGLEQGIAAVVGAGAVTDMVHLRALDSLAVALQGSFFSLHKDGPMDPARPGAFPVSDIALVGAKLLGAVALLGAYGVAWRRRMEPLDAALVILGVLVLVSPVLHPWYVLWVLPLAAVRGVFPWFVFAAVLPLAYLPLGLWWTQGVWREPRWVAWLEYGALALAFAGSVFLTKWRTRKARVL